MKWFPPISVMMFACSSSKYTLIETDNTPPEQPDLFISPNPAYTIDRLNAVVHSPFDADGDTVSLSYSWFKNGELTGETGNSINEELTVKNDIWRVEVIPNDGIESGPMAEATIVISNHPPVIDSVIISPNTPSISDVLICEANVYDPDENPTLTYAWRNLSTGMALGVGNIVSLFNVADYGDLIECRAVATDANGATEQQNATVIVENAAPIIGPIAFDPPVAYTNDTLRALASPTDPEGDPITRHYDWSVDGVAINTSDDQLDGLVHFDKGQTVSLSVTAEDPYSTSMPEQISIVILNSPPEEPLISIYPNAPEEEADLLCQLDQESQDNDNDPLSYVATWWRNGQLWTGATSSTHYTGDSILSINTAEGDLWECELTPHDGETNGSAGYAAVEIAAIPVNACPDGNCGLRFDGVDDRIEVPHDPSLSVNGNGWTVEAWIYYDALTGPVQDCMTAVRKGVSTSPTYEYWLHKNIGPADSLHWSSWSGWTVTSYGAAYVGGWLHYAGVADFVSGESRTYINGSFHSSGVANMPATNAETMLIGIDWDGGCAMNGVLDEIRISNTVRYSGSFSPALSFAPDSNTMALYHFDENSGNIAHDSSGNGNHGVITGAMWTIESP